MEYRRINLSKDSDVVLDLHCRVLFAADRFYDDSATYEQYFKKWLSTGQPDEFLQAVRASLQQENDVADLIEDEASNALGYIWVTVTNVPDYNFVFGEIQEISFKPEYQRMGLGTEALKYIEKKLIQAGIVFLRSSVSAHNPGSLRFHENNGFYPHRYDFEKKLFDAS